MIERKIFKLAEDARFDTGWDLPPNNTEVDVIPSDVYSNSYIILGYEYGHDKGRQHIRERHFQDIDGAISLSKELANGFMREDAKAKEIDVPERVFSLTEEF